MGLTIPRAALLPDIGTQTYDLRAYGGRVGVGSTDAAGAAANSDALDEVLALIDAAGAQNADIFLGFGQWTFARTLPISTASAVRATITVRGCGMGTQVRPLAGAGLAVFIDASGSGKTSVTRAARIQFRDMWLSTSSVDAAREAAATVCIRSQNSTKLVLQNVGAFHWPQFVHGINCQDAQFIGVDGFNNGDASLESWGMLFEHDPANPADDDYASDFLFFDRCTLEGGQWGSLRCTGDLMENVKIEACKFHGLGGAATNTSHAPHVYLEGYHHHISGSSFLRNAVAGINLAARGSVVDNCDFFIPGWTDVTLTGTATAGTASLSVSAASAGLVPGALLFIGNANGTYEWADVSAVVGTTVTLAANLANTYASTTVVQVLAVGVRVRANAGGPSTAAYDNRVTACSFDRGSGETTGGVGVLNEGFHTAVSGNSFLPNLNWDIVSRRNAIDTSHYLFNDNQLHAPLCDAIHISSGGVTVNHGEISGNGAQLWGLKNPGRYAAVRLDTNNAGAVIGANKLIGDGNARNGVYAKGSDHVITGNLIHGVGSGGVDCQATDCEIAANDIKFCGSGVALGQGSARNHVAANKIKTCTDGVIESGSADDNRIVGNDITGATTGITRVGAATVVRRNAGWKTEATGTGTMASGSTSVAVTHGLAATPTRALLSPTSDTLGIRLWVSAKGSTTFTVTTNTAPGSDVTFDWRALVGEE